jgi:hypothetical protein
MPRAKPGANVKNHHDKRAEMVRRSFWIPHGRLETYKISLPEKDRFFDNVQSPIYGYPADTEP